MISVYLLLDCFYSFEMEAEIRLKHGLYVILYAEKVAILPKNP
jgi:hypothetical protein